MTESYSMTTAALEHVQAVAFDLDGTLCDTQTVESYVGDGISKLVHRVITNDREKEADPEIWEKGFVFFMKYYRKHLSDFTRPYPETEAGLGLLKSLGIPLVVITNKNEILAAELLKKLNLDGYFSLVLGGDSLTEKKPSPLPLQHAAEVLGIDVANMLMVGDSKNDIIAAKATKPDLLIRALPEIYENLQPQKNKDEE